MEDKPKKLSDPILVSRFQDIKVKPEINPNIEDFYDLFSNEEFRTHLFDEAVKSFLHVFDKNKIIDHLKKEPNDESLKYLKMIRRYGLILKTTYRFVDKNHLCGEDLDQLLSLLGEFNDSYWISINENIRDEIIEKLDKFDQSFSVNFISTPELKEYVRSILYEIEILSKEKSLSMKRFHKLRKRIRLLSNCLQVAAAENYGGNIHWLFYETFKLSASLGQFHDTFVEKGLKSEIIYEETEIELDPSINIKFNQFRPFIEKVFGL